LQPWEAAFEEAAEASADPARNAALVEYGMALGAAKEWVRAGEVFERAGGGAPGFRSSRGLWARSF